MLIARAGRKPDSPPVLHIPSLPLSHSPPPPGSFRQSISSGLSPSSRCSSKIPQGPSPLPSRPSPSPVCLANPRPANVGRWSARFPSSHPTPVAPTCLMYEQHPLSGWCQPLCGELCDGPSVQPSPRPTRKHRQHSTLHTRTLRLWEVPGRLQGHPLHVSGHQVHCLSQESRGGQAEHKGICL